MDILRAIKDEKLSNSIKPNLDDYFPPVLIQIIVSYIDNTKIVFEDLRYIYAFYVDLPNKFIRCSFENSKEHKTLSKYKIDNNRKIICYKSLFTDCVVLNGIRYRNYLIDDSKELKRYPVKDFALGGNWHLALSGNRILLTKTYPFLLEYKIYDPETRNFIRENAISLPCLTENSERNQLIAASELYGYIYLRFPSEGHLKHMIFQFNIVTYGIKIIKLWLNDHSSVGGMITYNEQLFVIFESHIEIFHDINNFGNVNNYKNFDNFDNFEYITLPSKITWPKIIGLL